MREHRAELPDDPHLLHTADLRRVFAGLLLVLLLNPERLLELRRAALHEHLGSDTVKDETEDQEDPDQDRAPVGHDEATERPLS